jgi:beta-1,4-N-acetylglucosaminyltransferase
VDQPLAQVEMMPQNSEKNSNIGTSRKQKVLVTLAGGGFFWEAKALIKELGQEYNIYYVTTHDSVSLIRKDFCQEDVYFMSKVTSMTYNSANKRLRSIFAGFYDAYKVIKKIEPSVVICIGSSIAVPLCFWAKLLGRKTVFIESITRVSQPSLTGRILSLFNLCDRFYVQWPEAQQLYKGAVYRGVVL